MDGHLQRALGNNLRRWRKERQLSQEEMAEVLAVHRTYMGGVERGERNLTLRSVEQIAETLGLDPLDLLRDQPSPE
ncbi:helix-turn-helix transcriptional regulator [Rhodococcus sp. IEGM 1302]|uniref:helix-turn-helix domain-containing protein n=1 Tax=Rhodococcus sp. IEGM 1302 TaxID=3047093 RepID=UPI0024B6DF7C|nr:helix-turn-helix transcriptional regulator [Rhodococcus sp. IEGM 1302]MDI9947017.1 helix-turn-helix transcriptional regulator [Rhodococcus sp. IEGM 1302]